MGHSTNAPAGHRLPHAMTMPSLHSSSGSSSPTLDAKTHKHFHSHNHVATPYPVLEHSTSLSNVESDSSTGSTDYMQSHTHHHHIHRPSVPNPVHMVSEHVSEFKFGHTARSAKREASKSSSHPWSLDASLARANSIPEEKYEEVVEDWKERDEQAWAAELRKRDAARRSYGGFTATTTDVDENQA